MIAGTVACLLMAVLFLLIGIVFAVYKERAAILISGFNNFPKEKREKYDRLKMSRDMRNLCFSWTGLFFVGGVLSYFISGYIAIIIFIVWLILFFREVHFDTEKAFGKYKKDI